MKVKMKRRLLTLCAAFALILLMCIIKIMTAIGDSREKKNAAAAAPVKAAEPAPVAAPPKKP